MKDHSVPGPLTQWVHKSDYGLSIRGYKSPDTGRPIIHFLHGNGLCGLVYWPMLQELLKDFDLLITDIQGHGDTDNGKRFLGWNENAAICERLLQRLLNERKSPDQPVFGVGHSLGGVLSILMTQHNPTAFKKLVLLDPVIFPKTMLTAMIGLKSVGLLAKVSPLSRKALKRRSSWPSRMAAYRYFEGRGIFRDWDEAALQSFISHALYEQANRQFTLKCPPLMESSIFASYPRKLWKTLNGLSIPTELIMAENTFPFAQNAALMLSRTNAWVNVSKVAGGHCFVQERPTEIARLVRTKLHNQ